MATRPRPPPAPAYDVRWDKTLCCPPLSPSSSTAIAVPHTELPSKCIQTRCTGLVDHNLPTGQIPSFDAYCKGYRKSRCKKAYLAEIESEVNNWLNESDMVDRLAQGDTQIACRL